MRVEARKYDRQNPIGVDMQSKDEKNNVHLL